MTKEVTYGLLIFITLMVWFIGFFVIIGLDTYTKKDRKKLFALIIVLVYLHMMQNYLEYWVGNYHPNDRWRQALAIFGYSIRPVILALFAKMIVPKKRHLIAWILVGINLIMYLSGFWTSYVFSIKDNHYVGGPLHFWCLMTSGMLLAYLVYLNVVQYKKEKLQKREIFFHLFWILIIIAGILADAFVSDWQWVGYLTISMACVTVFSYIWFHQENVREFQNEFITEQRMKLLLSQIQPHFIYNTLSSIRNIEGNPEETKQAITEFANYIRGNLASLDGKELIPFAKEIEFVKDYVSLQQRRFPDRIEINYDITDENFSVPPLTVQILVENAIKHGILVRYDKGTIDVRARREKRYHVIEVVDDGVGFNPAILETTDRVGLRAVKNRLTYYQDGAISIESEPGKGTAVTIKIPVISHKKTFFGINK